MNRFKIEYWTGDTAEITGKTIEIAVADHWGGPVGPSGYNANNVWWVGSRNQVEVMNTYGDHCATVTAI
jgi:hypothetical protein